MANKKKIKPIYIVLIVIVSVIVLCVTISGIQFALNQKNEANKPKNEMMLTSTEEDKIEKDCINALIKFSLWEENHMS